jgi:hypothetical protein
MALSRTATLEHELLEKVTHLSAAQKREALDFIEFIAARSPSRLKKRGPSYQDFSAIIDIANCGDGETDLSVNHDKYLYGEDAP